MAAKKPKKQSAALAADEGAVIPRLSTGETGFVGLRTIWGQIIEDPNRAFRHPYFFRTVQEMRNDALISSIFAVYRMFLCRVPWTVEAPVGATDEQKERAKFVQSLMDDMEHPWSEFVSDVVEYLPYGFSIQEKVFRRRLKKNGSRYNDGKVGLRKLSPRGQDTIYRWVFSEDGRELLGVEQSIANLEHGAMFMNLANERGLIPIPREKFLLFTADKTKGNPQGTSVLKGVYKTFKEMEALKNQELLGIAKEAAGLPMIQIPPKYMSDDASPAEKAVYDMCKTIVDNLAAGTQRGIVFPKQADPETKTDMFSVGLLEKKGIPGANIDTVIRRYQNDILCALSVDILRSGDNQGSFSLNDGDTNILAIALSHRLNEIASVLNHDLIPNIFRLNGWEDEQLPKFTPADISKVSLEEFSKAIQRVASTGVLELDRGVLNKVREVLGVTKRPDDEPVDKEALTTNVSSSGKGMEVGTTGDGTSKIGGGSSGQDRSTNNNDNKA